MEAPCFTVQPDKCPPRQRGEKPTIRHSWRLHPACVPGSVERWSPSSQGQWRGREAFSVSSSRRSELIQLECGPNPGVSHSVICPGGQCGHPCTAIFIPKVLHKDKMGREAHWPPARLSIKQGPDEQLLGVRPFLWVMKKSCLSYPLYSWAHQAPILLDQPPGPACPVPVDTYSTHSGLVMVLQEPLGYP